MEKLNHFENEKKSLQNTLKVQFLVGYISLHQQPME